MPDQTVEYIIALNAELPEEWTEGLNSRGERIRFLKEFYAARQQELDLLVVAHPEIDIYSRPEVMPQVFARSPLEYFERTFNTKIAKDLANPGFEVAVPEPVVPDFLQSAVKKIYYNGIGGVAIEKRD